jgi:hypothetical protein
LPSLFEETSMIFFRNIALRSQMAKRGLQEELLIFSWENRFSLKSNKASGAGDLPPCARSEPDLNLSAHPVPIIQPWFYAHLRMQKWLGLPLGYSP